MRAVSAYRTVSKLAVVAINFLSYLARLGRLHPLTACVGGGQRCLHFLVVGNSSWKHGGAITREMMKSADRWREWMAKGFHN